MTMLMVASKDGAMARLLKTIERCNNNMRYLYQHLKSEIVTQTLPPGSKYISPKELHYRNKIGLFRGGRSRWKPQSSIEANR